MMKKTQRMTTLMSLFLFCLCTVCQAQQTFCLDGTWRFKFCKDAETADRYVQQGFYSPSYKDTDFDSQPVPSNWALQGYEEPVYRGFVGDKASEGLYIKDFTLPKLTDGRILLHFGGVWASAEVWMNGKHVDRHDSGYTSFVLNVSNYINKDGSPNRLAVRVRQVHDYYKFDTYDDWTLGGIYRPVYIETMSDLLWIDHVQVAEAFSDNYTKARVTARVFVNDRQKQLLPGNYPSPGVPYQLRATLADHNGKVVAHKEMTIPAHVATGRQTDMELEVDHPELWNAETPNLYRLSVALYLPKGAQLRGTKPVPQGVVVDALANDQQGRETLGTFSQEWATTPHNQWNDRIGLREITTTGAVLRINGKPVKFHGVNYHNEYPTVGRAQTKEMWIKDLQQMKRTNINYLRLCHYPHAKEFIELCDSIGFYCTEEIPLGGGNEKMLDAINSAQVLQRTYETVTRDLNRPSIIAWTVGNEDAFSPLHQAAARACKAFDPTRPRLIPWRYENFLPMDDIDILSVHYWHPCECDSLTRQANRPVISTEYTHAFGEMGMGGLDKRYHAMIKNPQGVGAAIWMWQDQGLKMPTPLEAGKDNIMRKGDAYLRLSDAGWDGIVDSYRRQGRDWEEAREVYNPVYPVKDTLALQLPMLNIPLYNAYDFTDMQTVRVAWQSYDDSGKLLKKGIMQAPACQPHQTATLSLPAHKAMSYVHLTFTDKDGIELGKRYVTVMGGTVQTPKAKLAAEALRTLLKTMKPCVWRKPDNSEESVIGKKLVRNAPKNWNQYKVEQIGADTYRYVYNDSNSVTFTFKLTEKDNGIKVDYTVKPTLSVPRVPVIGVTLEMPNDMKDLSWRGLGPMNCYSNKLRAAVDGVWTMKDNTNPGIAGSLGTKRTAWVETCGYHIAHDGYVETDGKTLRLLIGVAARPEKGRRANHEFPEYGSSASDPAYSGSFFLYKK